MKYTIILNRSLHLLDIFDMDTSEGLYVANPDKDFATLEEAVVSARQEVAKADAQDMKAQMSERGIRMHNPMIDPAENYEVVLVLEGHSKVLASGPRDLKLGRLNQGYGG